MNTSKLIWATSATDTSPDASNGGASWAALPAPLASSMSAEQHFALQSLYSLAYARAQAQVAQKQERFRELVADVDFERVAQEQSRFRTLIEGIDFSSQR